MSSRILGAIAATITAHATVLFLWTFIGILHDKGIVLEIIGLPFAALVIGAFASVIYGIPLFMLAYLLGSLAHYWQRENRWIAIVTGGGVGLCYPLTIFNVLGLGGPNLELNHPTELWPYILSGCFSGYVYWLIAVPHRKPKADLY